MDAGGVMARKPWIVSADYQGECRRMVNGSQKLVWTLAMSSCGIVFVGLMTWMTSLTGKVDVHAQTIAALASNVESTERRFIGLDVRLVRIEDKVDRLLERRPMNAK